MHFTYCVPFCKYLLAVTYVVCSVLAFSCLTPSLFVEKRSGSVMGPELRLAIPIIY